MVSPCFFTARRKSTSETVPETLARHALHAENPGGFGYFTKSLLIRGTCAKFPPLGYKGLVTLIPSLIRGTCPLNSPLIRGARGVKNDERWVSYTVSFAGTTNIEFLHSLLRVKPYSMYGACVSFVDYLASKKKRLEPQ